MTFPNPYRKMALRGGEMERLLRLLVRRRRLRPARPQMLHDGLSMCTVAYLVSRFGLRRS